MLLSKSCVYGLRASLYLASKRDGEFYSLKDISEELDISFHFLTKILQQLTADGLMESYKGPNGGVRLSQKGKKSTLYDMVIAIDGPGLFTQCALGLPGCGSQEPCPLHESWIGTRESIEKMLRRTSLIEIAKEGKEKHFRLTAEGHFTWQ
ncbi:MAG: Rrf2 family transcriptional regulator [Gracilimonas sp.]|uniref:RrF2 family transcriptional regulator n=1 Tax=Gracilimonas sp. TaxID=1974203 RepID=UPI001999A364|nr:Rrf2 family transcriptional regulator [Gracilimonas sp.]MBD3615024.1 Rrf2 family transcriptional regulator [Gracilimonas sp.]